MPAGEGAAVFLFSRAGRLRRSGALGIEVIHTNGFLASSVRILGVRKEGLVIFVSNRDQVMCWPDALTRIESRSRPRAATEAKSTRTGVSVLSAIASKTSLSF